MNEPPHKLLVSGEFWHKDFADLISRVEVPTTLIPGEKLSQLIAPTEQYTAVLVCQSRRGSVSQTFVNHVRNLFPQAPLALLLGSWCEGETRSGNPLQGVTRMYWHEWNGSYGSLAARLHAHGIHLPNSLNNRRPQEILRSADTEAGPLTVAEHSAATEPCVIGVSALTLCQFETLEEPLRALGATPIWLEQATWRACDPQEIAAVCLDSDGVGELLYGRVELAREIVPTAPLILTLNFPRKEELSELRSELNVKAVLSKPFDLHMLWQALEKVGIALPEPAPTSIAPSPAPVNLARPLATSPKGYAAQR
jgi:hypothetical protein